MKKARVLVSDKLSESGLAVLKAAAPHVETDVKTGMKPEELVQIIGEYDGLVVRSATKVSKAVIEAAKKLRVVGRAGIGVDNVDVGEASRHGILVMNTPEGNVVTTAEHAIALMCALVRKIPQATALMRAGQWEKTKFQGRELFNKTLGIIGLGNIGRVVADRAQGLQMTVIAYDPFVTQQKAHELGVELVELDALLARADIVTLHVPVTDATRNIISAQAIEKMKPGAFLVNAARGGLCDEEAVATAVKSGRLSGAAFDVFAKEPPEPTNPLLSIENVILTPHLGASTDEAQENVSIAVAHQIVDFLKTGAIKNAVNAPNVGQDLLAVLNPWAQLAHKMGRLCGLLHTGNVRSYSIVLRGAAAEFPSRPLAVAGLSGLLKTRLEGVNEVNAPLLAKERGIEVVESRSPLPHTYASSVDVTVEGDGTKTEVSGAVFGAKDARIVSVRGMALEIVPEGHILLTRHNDRPGMLGRLGTTLGQRNINISRLTLGFIPGDSGLASAAFGVDTPVPDAVLDELRAIDGVVEVRQVNLSA